MPHKYSTLVVALVISVASTAILADVQAFSAGPIFNQYGETVAVENGLPNAAEQHFKVVFDIAEQTSADTVNRGFNSVARFINMHVRAGVPLNNIDVAIVVHGSAVVELLNEAAYVERFDKANLNQDLLEQLIRAGATVELCGQSAAFANIDAKNLLPGISMSLSAMTAHALLQQRGYTLNPF
jgi:intracellular sulfur oxidation DsrE/DsrF family protein